MMLMLPRDYLLLEGFCVCVLEPFCGPDQAVATARSKKKKKKKKKDKKKKKSSEIFYSRRFNIILI